MNPYAVAIGVCVLIIVGYIIVGAACFDNGDEDEKLDAAQTVEFESAHFKRKL